MSLPYLLDQLGSRQARQPMHYQHLIPSSLERLKFTISFCFKASSITLDKVALLSETLTAYFGFYCVIYLYKLLITTVYVAVSGPSMDNRSCGEIEIKSQVPVVQLGLV